MDEKHKCDTCESNFNGYCLLRNFLIKGVTILECNLYNKNKNTTDNEIKISESAFNWLVFLLEKHTKPGGCGGGRCPCYSYCYYKKNISCRDALKKFLKDS